jgi:MFS family permease
VADLLHVGLLATLPQIAGIIGTILMGRHSDKTRERRWHYATCVAVAAISLLAITFSHGNLVASVIGLTLAGLGFISATPLFFTTITEYLSKASAAGGIALISSLGNLGPAVAPSVTGYITATTGNSLLSTYYCGSLPAVRLAVAANREGCEPKRTSCRARIDVLRRPSGGPDGSRSKNGRRKCDAFFEVLEAVRPRSSLALPHEP